MPTDLQRELVSTFENLDGARERLSGLAYVAFIAIVLERVLKETARLGFGEAIRASRGWK